MNTGPAETPRLPNQSSTKTGASNPAWSKPVFFPGWRDCLMLEPLHDDTKARYIRAIATFLSHCKSAGKLASIGVAKTYLDTATEQGNCSSVDRDALRWFFRTHKQEGGNRQPEDPRILQSRAQPIPAGTSDWEAKLITAIRTRGLLWNTEQTYRNCLRRFAQSIAPLVPDQAGDNEVRSYLTQLAVQKRASPSAQRQALNALVFFFRHALKRDLGDISDFQRARVPHPRIPVVLSREELDRLFAALPDRYSYWVGNSCSSALAGPSSIYQCRAPLAPISAAVLSSDSIHARVCSRVFCLREHPDYLTGRPDGRLAEISSSQ